MKRFNIIIWTFFPVVLFGQTPKLTESTKDEFDVFRNKEISFVKSDKIVKTGKTIIVKTKKGTVIKFEDDLSDENYSTNEYVGDLIKDNIVLIKTQDYNSDRFIAVDLATGDQKTLIGFPRVYGDKIICLQGAETDVVQEIELWKIKDNKLTQNRTFNFGDKIYPADIVWTNESEIIIKDSRGKFWKTRVDGK
jgi:hypothetical protein